MSSQHYALFNNSSSSRLQAPCPHSEPEMAATALWGRRGRQGERVGGAQHPRLRCTQPGRPLFLVKGVSGWADTRGPRPGRISAPALSSLPCIYQAQPHGLAEPLQARFLMVSTALCPLTRLSCPRLRSPALLGLVDSAGPPPSSTPASLAKS